MRILSFVLLAFVYLTQPLAAQGLFSPIVKVNDDVVTRYELNQRVAMLDALGARGDLREQALEGLIGDRLRIAASAQAGIVSSDALAQEAMAQFASRNGQTVDGLLGILSTRGVSKETFRDFVVANHVWQTLMRQRYGASIAVSDAEVDAALEATGDSTNLRVLVSEVVLPLIEGQEDEIRKLAEDISKIRSLDEFSNAAKQFSVAGSRADGGKLDWIPLSNLPQALRLVILPLAVGEVSEPLELPNAIALFQMRGLAETAPTSGSVSSVEYALASAPSPDDGSVAAAFGEAGERAVRCDDLFGLTKGVGAVAVEIRTQLPSDIPRQEALWLARLDAGETLVESSVRADGTAQTHLIMLCNRTSAANKNASRDDVRLRLLNEKLNARAESLLESLKASARISYQ